VVVNIEFLVIAKYLSGPFLGIAVNVVYCRDSVFQCFQLEHLSYSAISLSIAFVTVMVIVIFSKLYFFKNPLQGNYRAYPNCNFALTKGIFKLLLPIVFAMNEHLQLQFLFIICAPLVWAGYLYFHRLNSLHSYNSRHFYIELYF
jgi:hypothetical protein